MPDQAESLRQLARVGNALRPRARVIAITSGKGGVGKTNLAVNLGLALRALGLRAGVLDADLGLANIDIVLGLAPTADLGDVIFGKKRLAEIEIEGPAGLRVFPGGSGVHELANLSQWRLERFTAALGELDDRLDVLLVDTGAGISRNVLTFVLSVDEVIVVTTPEPTAIADAYGMVKVISRENPQAKLRLVVNLAKDERQAQSVCTSLGRVADQFLAVQLEYLGRIPPDEAVPRAVAAQLPLLLAFPASKASRATESLAVRLVGQQVVGSGVQGFFRRIAQLAVSLPKRPSGGA